MEFTKTELNELVGKRVTVNGVRHRVAKVSARDKTITTEDKLVVDCADIYRRGRGFFADPEEKGTKSSKKKAAKAETPKKKAKVKAEPEAKTGRKGGRRKVDVEEEAPVTGKRRRKVEVEEEVPVKAKRRRKAEEEEAPVKGKRRRKDVAEAKPAKTKDKVKAKPYKFDQKHTERLVAAIADHIAALTPELAPNLKLATHGGVYNDEVVVVTLGFATNDLNNKELKEVLARSAHHVQLNQPDDSLDDFSDDEEEELDEEEDDDLDDDDLDDTYDEEGEDEDDLEDDLEDEDDDEGLEADDEDEDEDDEQSVEERIDEMVADLLVNYPDLKEKRVRSYVEQYLLSEEVEEAFGDDMMPCETKLSLNDLEFILIGYDGKDVRLLNPRNGKFRSASIGDVARMDILE